MHGLIIPLPTDTPYAEGYQWFALMPPVEAEFVPEEDGLYELVFKVATLHSLLSECPQAPFLGQRQVSLSSLQHKNWQYTCLCDKRSRRAAQI